MKFLSFVLIKIEGREHRPKLPQAHELKSGALVATLSPIFS